MFSRTLPLSPDARRRVSGIVIALLIEALILIALLSLGVVPGIPRKAQDALSLFNVLPDAPKSTKAAQARKATTPKRAPATTPPPPTTQAPPPPIRNPHTLQAPPGMIVLDKDQYAKADIGKMPAHPAEGDADAGADSGKDSGTAYGPGEGPGGAPLYYAEWYREPSHAELAGYLPAGIHEGAAMIACKTIENYHVDNCRSLGEVPVGTGLARAMRLASWQFLVRPPRRGGKTLIGAWVRIRFDLTAAGDKE